jgi:site-specific DNA-methyltransferase (adenine-specific)
MQSIVECCDCMDFMAKFPDKFFDLAICDPPYGIDVANMNMGIGSGKRCSKIQNRIWKPKSWDKKIPSNKYFKELFRVSYNQIIWGGNYFPLKPSRCFVIWDKAEGMYDRDFSECELAWVSMNKPTRLFKKNPVQIDRIHPCQKPVDLYIWQLEKFAKPGDKILDTHLGSQSSRIAARIMGFDFWGCEIDPKYFADGCKRFEKESAQEILFQNPQQEKAEQQNLFGEV